MAHAKTDDEQAHTDVTSPDTADDVCGDASTVQGDVSDVQGDLLDLRGNQTDYESSVTPTAADVGRLNQDMTTSEMDEVALPATAQSGLLTQAKVNAAIAKLN